MKKISNNSLLVCGVGRFNVNYRAVSRRTEAVGLF